jgi:hypothetical protein
LFDFFHFRDLSRNFDHAIHNQSWGHKDAVVGDRFDILHLDHLGFNPELFDRLLCSLRELIALRSTHSKNFDLFHRFYLLCP